MGNSIYGISRCNFQTPEERKKMIQRRIEHNKNEKIKKEQIISQFGDDNDKWINAIRENGLLILYIPKKFKTRELCLDTVKNNGESIKFIPPCYQQDIVFISECLKQTKGKIKFCFIDNKILYYKNEYYEYNLNIVKNGNGEHIRYWRNEQLFNYIKNNLSTPEEQIEEYIDFPFTGKNKYDSFENYFDTNKCIKFPDYIKSDNPIIIEKCKDNKKYIKETHINHVKYMTYIDNKNNVIIIHFNNDEIYGIYKGDIITKTESLNFVKLLNEKIFT